MVSAPAYLALLSSYDPLARGLFDRSPEQGGPRRGRISRTLKKLRAAGIVSRGDCLWVHSAADATIARQNWLSSSYTLTAVNSPTFTADRGYTGDGASAYLTTGFVPSTAGGKFSLNDASIGVWLRTSATGVQRIEIGVNEFTAPTSYLAIEINSFNEMATRVNSLVGSRVDVGGAAGQTGLWVAERTGASSARVLKNGVVQATGAPASSVLPPLAPFILARNNNGSPSLYSPDEVSMSYIGGALTDEQHVAFHDIFREWQTEVGAM